MYQISTGAHTFDVELDSTGTTGTVNNQDVSVDIANLTGNSWHLIKDDKSYNVQVVKAEMETKTFTIWVNGKEYEVKAKDDFDLLLDKMGLADLATSKVNDVKAPMPGLVLKIMVKAGQEIKKDEPIIILEAMKMENVLKSPTDGVVKDVCVEQGDAVEKNTVLIAFELYCNNKQNL